MRTGAKADSRTVGAAGARPARWAAMVLLWHATISLAAPVWTAEAGALGAVDETADATDIAPLLTLLAQAKDAAAWRAFSQLVQALPDSRRAQLLRSFCLREQTDAIASAFPQGLCRGVLSGSDAPPASSTFPAAVAAQVETDAAPRAIAGAVDLGASLSSGDTQERAFSVRVEARQQLGGRWSHELAVDGDWARRSGATSQQRLTGDHRLFYTFSERATVFQFLRGEYDRFAGFDYRITESIGVGYDAIRKPQLIWHLEGGPGVRFIALADSSAMEQEPIVRLSSELTWHLRPNWTVENQSSAFLGGEGNTLENKISLEARINSALFGRVSLHLRYDTKELAGISKLDTLTKFSIGYRF